MIMHLIYTVLPFFVTALGHGSATYGAPIVYFPSFYGVRTVVQVNNANYAIPVCHDAIQKGKSEECEFLSVSSSPEASAEKFCRELKIAPVRGMRCSDMIADEIHAELSRHERRAQLAKDYSDPIVAGAIGFFVADLIKDRQNAHVVEWGCSGIGSVLGGVLVQGPSPACMPFDIFPSASACLAQTGSFIINVVTNVRLADLWAKDVMAQKAFQAILSDTSDCAMIPETFWIEAVYYVTAFRVARHYSVDGRTGAVDFVLACKADLPPPPIHAPLLRENAIARSHFQNKYGPCIQALYEGSKFYELLGHISCGLAIPKQAHRNFSSFVRCALHTSCEEASRDIMSPRCTQYTP